MKNIYITTVTMLLLMVGTFYSQHNDTLRIVHLSDSHVVYRLDECNPIFRNLRKHLLGSEDSLLSIFKTIPKKVSADAVVITGDIIDYFEAEITHDSYDRVNAQIEQFKSIYNKCKVPLYLTLGNHDIATYLVDEKDSTKIESQVYADKSRLSWSKNYSCFENGTYYRKEFVVGTRKYHFIFLDNGYKLRNGSRFDKTQLDWLNEQLNIIGDEIVILFFHIYLPVGDLNGDGRYFIKSASWPSAEDYNKGFLKILDEHKNIKAMFVGHQHRNVWEEIFLPSGHSVYQVETSATFKSTNNWRLIEFTEDAVIVNKQGCNKIEKIIRIVN